MDSTSRSWRLGLLLTGLLLGAAGPCTGQAVPAPANPELDRMLSKLPDPAKWKESPLQNALDPATHDPELAKVAAALKANKFPEGLRRMRAVAARYPTHPIIQYTYGRLALLMHSYAEAEKAFVAAAAERKIAALCWYYAGATQFLEHRLPEAASSMRRCIRSNPPPLLAVSAWTAMAYYDTLDGDHSGAISAAAEGTKLAPANGVVWAVRGFCESEAKHYSEAVADYHKAISLNHQLAIAYEGLGTTYVATNRPQEAITPLKTALSLAPGNYLAALRLGYCYLETNQPGEGVRVCHEAVTKHPDFAPAWKVLGLCYEKLGRHREAQDAFARAARLTRGHAETRAHLAEVARAAGKLG